MLCVGDEAEDVGFNVESDRDDERESDVKTPAEPVAETEPKDNELSTAMMERTGVHTWPVGAVCVRKTTEVEVAIVVDVTT
jgi:hypothetical protein